MKRTGFSVGAAAWLLAAGMMVPAHADVRTITISTRGPALNGQSFGTVGPYEQITGIATGEIDPADMRDAARRFSEKKDRPNQSRRPNG